MPYLTTHKAEIYYEVHGEGHPMVFAHGVGGNSLAWWQQIPIFAKNHQVIVFDHRGFGCSTDPEKLGRSEFVNDLEALVHHLDLNKPILVGQSMGGIATSGYLSRHLENVSALVMADTLLGLEIPELIEKDLNAERAKHESLAQIERAVSAKTRQARPDLIYLFSHISAFNEVNRKTLRGDFSRVSLEKLSKTGTPILFIVGEEDFLFAPEFVKTVHQQLAGSEYKQITGSGHSPYFEDAGSFNTVLAEFLSKHQLGG